MRENQLIYFFYQKRNIISDQLRDFYVFHKNESIAIIPSP